MQLTATLEPGRSRAVTRCPGRPRPTVPPDPRSPGPALRDDGAGSLARPTPRLELALRIAEGPVRRRAALPSVRRDHDRVDRRLQTGRCCHPVAQVLSVRLPEGVRRLPLRPVFPDQEVDARAAGQPVYWEGAVRTVGGRGYLELTGYAADLRM